MENHFCKVRQCYTSIFRRYWYFKLRKSYHKQKRKHGAVEYEHISWVDIYIIEDGKWKIGAAHSFDYRLELPEK